MGALHEGHLSLVAAAKHMNCTTLTSIFVNPRQFNNPDDLLRYPRTLDLDIRLLEQAGCDAVFIPESDQVYLPDAAIPHIPLGNLADRLEGSFRPGHFQGVIDVLWSLFQAIKPSNVFFGEKDFQQCMVVKKLLDAQFPEINMHIIPTKREADGLAMSSRNRRLSAEGRLKAPTIFQALQQICAQKQQGVVPQLLAEARAFLERHNISTEYLELAVPETLEPLNHWTSDPAVLLFAGHLEEVRLIDNMRC